MLHIRPVFLLFVLFIWGSTGFFCAGSDTIPPQIINPDTSVIHYCSDSVKIIPNISISNVTFDNNSEGMKISIANYKNDEDILVWKAHAGFQYVWDGVKGDLEIKGAGNTTQYENAIADVFYKNIAEVPDLGIRSFSIGLLDADYLPETEHFYRYVSSLDITWEEARDSAARMKYYGLQGYLATITSVEENDFIWTKIDGVGWIGATDSEKEGTSEGRWIWATGPEAGIHFWQGIYNGYKVNGRYSFWNEGEPNNSIKVSGDDEDYAHINSNPNSVPKSWNDLPNGGDGPNSQYYRAQGFVVEFGGMSDDPEVSLSASASIQVSKIAFSNKREYEICLGESVELNVETDGQYTYSWTPGNYISSTSVSNPVAYPSVNTVYTAVGKLDYCIDTAEFYVQVHSLPENKLKPEYIICKGDSVVLDPGEHSSYLWSTGEITQTITVSDEDWYTIALTNEYGCETYDSISVKYSIKPVLDYSSLDTLVCGSKSQTINLSFISGSASTVLTVVQPDKVNIEHPDSSSPTINVDDFGTYQFVVEIKDTVGCLFADTLEIGFHNQPLADFETDEEKCKGYNLELNYNGDTYEETMFTWLYNDSVYFEAEGLEQVIIPLGFGQLGRTVGLLVNEQGCVDSSSVQVTVTPNVEVFADVNEGCTPLQVNFDAKSTEAVQQYAWEFGDGNTSDIRNPQSIYENLETTVKTFDLGLTVTSLEGCENSGILSDYITVYPIPTVGLSFDEDDCNPETMEIYYVGSGNGNDIYNWDLSDLLPEEILQHPANTKGPLEIKRSSGPFADLGIQVVSEFGCKTDTAVFNWKRKPVFFVSVDTSSGCPPLAVSVEANVSDPVDQVNFIYSLGDGITGNGNTAEHIYAEENSKNVIRFIATSSVTGCSDTVVYDDTIHVYPVPSAAFYADPEVALISDAEINFYNETAGADNYEWGFDDMSAVSVEENPVHHFNEMGFYQVELKATNLWGCFDTVSHEVAISFDKLFPPNAFSPNATLEQDREFRIYSKGVADNGYQLLIFNRWGEVIFKSTSKETGWDGKMKNGNFAPQGVYTWVIQYFDFTGKEHKQQGTVTLLF